MPYGDANARIVEFQCVPEVLHNEDIFVPVIFQFLDEGDGHRVIGGEDHVVFGFRRKLLRRPVSRFGFDPGGVEKLDEGERKQGEKEDHPGKEHHYGKESGPSPNER